MIKKTFQTLRYSRRCSIYVLAAMTALTLPPAVNARETAAKKVNVGDLLFFNGDRAAAKSAYTRAVQLDPNCFDAHMRLLNLDLQDGNLDASIDECHEILHIKPNQKEALLALGNLLRTKGELDEAVKVFEQALESGANPAMTQHALGLTLLQKADLQGAEEHVAQAVKLQKIFPEAQLSLGVIKYKLGDKDGAIACLEDAIKQKHGVFPEARNVIGDIYCNSGAWDKGLEQYQAATKDDPKSAQAWASIGNAQIKLSNFTAAREALKKAQALNPDDKNLFYGMGVCLEKTGDISQALSQFQKGLMLEQDPLMRAQIKLHMSQLGTTNNLDLGSGGSAADSFVRRAAEQDPFGVTFSDMIKLKPPGEKKKIARSKKGEDE
jgi:tetratricopeptide (TPR) repeat protein